MKEIKMFPLVGSFGENKDKARDIRMEEVLPVIEDNRDVAIDFKDVGSVTQSFIHALISDILRKYGPEVLDHIFFRNCNENVKKIISIVVEYMQESE